MTTLVAVFTCLFLFGLGAIVGSFLTVVIARVPAGESIVRPRSSCPGCGEFISWFDNIPLVSWLMLGGKCRRCHEPIPLRYPLVELVTAIAFGLVGLASLMGAYPLIFVPTFLIISAAGIALVAIDLEHFRLPNQIVATTYVLAALAVGIGLIADGFADHVAGVMGGMLLWGVVFGGAWLVTRGRGMGLGDVKLAPLLGASLGMLGFVESAIGLLITFLVGASVGLWLLASRRVQRRQAIPFGPFMIMGWFATVLLGSPLASWYLTVVLGRYPS